MIDLGGSVDWTNNEGGMGGDGSVPSKKYFTRKERHKDNDDTIDTIK